MWKKSFKPPAANFPPPGHYTGKKNESPRKIMIGIPPADAPGKKLEKTIDPGNERF